MSSSIKSASLITLALLMYGTLSYPFPQSPGVIEAAIALCLLLFVRISVGVLLASGSFQAIDRMGVIPGWLHVLFFFLLWWGLLNGVFFQRNALSDVIRDMIPCVYLFIPLFLLPAMRKSAVDWGQYLPWVISIVGVAFALRFYLAAGISLADIGKRYFSDFLLYFPYDPSVIFAGVFLPLSAVQLFKLTSPLRILASIACIVGGILALGSLLAVAQRAPIGLAVLCFGLYGICLARQSLYKLVLILLFFAGIFLLAQDQIMSSLELLQAKQSEYGANGKTDEMYTIFGEMIRVPEAFLFGRGWGGLFLDPIYMLKVSYTHSVVTYYMLKGGMFGLLTFGLYLLWVMRHLVQSVTLRIMPAVLASLVPMSIGMLFQPSYKTLTYGIILTLVCTFRPRVQANKKRTSSVPESSGLTLQTEIPR